MSKQISSAAYLRFAFVHTFISVLGVFLIVSLYIKSEQLKKIIVRLDSTELDRWEIMQKIWSNCSQSIIDYPELHAFPYVELCESYDLAFKLEKVVAVLLILYYTYLLNPLYDSIFVPTIIMDVISTLFLYFINHQWTLILFQSILMSMGVVILFTHCLLPNFNEYLKQQWLKFKNWLLKDNSDRLRDNNHRKKDEHED
jgi:hypothetical protein